MHDSFCYYVIFHHLQTDAHFFSIYMHTYILLKIKQCIKLNFKWKLSLKCIYSFPPHLFALRHGFSVKLNALIATNHSTPSKHFKALDLLSTLKICSIRCSSTVHQLSFVLKQIHMLYGKIRDNFDSNFKKYVWNSYFISITKINHFISFKIPSKCPLPMSPFDIVPSFAFSA